MLKRLRPLSVDGFFEGHSNKWEVNEEPSAKQQKPNHFLAFCDVILQYEKYPAKEEQSGNSLYSPSGSDRTNDSYSTESNSSFDSDHGENENQDDDDVNNDDESWDLITCHCMKPFAGRPMIECTKCQTWIHMSCAKIRRNNIPEDFVCQHCREEQSCTRRSERIRSEERRIVTS